MQSMIIANGLLNALLEDITAKGLHVTKPSKHKRTFKRISRDSGRSRHQFTMKTYRYNGRQYLHQGSGR
ncbi:hypothetical protein EUGRSUZ_C03416 [Eucalyptus grandis]|uniref:Uncharacterized protein n=2 Tax=Eucalyptus grandis TaxID=71139 RepID=A0ACC3LIW5_EUCGR|nr:hypothetical protein EUGRSUZ_C03416 [Eucalyptus grandis]